MAEDLRFRGVDVKKRNPWGIFGLTLITVGIYGFVWWYKMNRELRDYSAAAGAPLNNNPARSVLAFIPGFLLIIPPFVSIWKTCERIETVRARVEGRPVQSFASTGLLAILLYIVAALHGVLLGYAMNDMWDSAKARAGTEGLPELVTGAPA
jgi:Domain of unknown function (DUF4234)